MLESVLGNRYNTVLSIGDVRSILANWLAIFT